MRSRKSGGQTPTRICPSCKTVLYGRVSKCYKCGLSVTSLKSLILRMFAGSWLKNLFGKRVRGDAITGGKQRLLHRVLWPEDGFGIDHTKEQSRASILRKTCRIWPFNWVIRAMFMKPLIGVLRDKSQPSHIRSRAADMMVTIGRSSAIQVLIQELHDPDCDIVGSIVKSLASFRDENVVEPLIEAIEIQARSDGQVCAWAAEALGEIADKRAVVPLMNLYQRSSTFNSWEREYAAEAAIKALGRIHDSRSDDLISAYYHEKRIKRDEEKKRKEQIEEQRKEEERLRAGSKKCPRCAAVLEWWSKSTLARVWTNTGMPGVRPQSFAGVCTTCRDGFCLDHSDEGKCPFCGSSLKG